MGYFSGAKIFFPTPVPKQKKIILHFQLKSSPSPKYATDGGRGSSLSDFHPCLEYDFKIVVHNGN